MLAGQIQRPLIACQSLYNLPSRETLCFSVTSFATSRPRHLGHSAAAGRKVQLRSAPRWTWTGTLWRARRVVPSRRQRAPTAHEPPREVRAPPRSRAAHWRRAHHFLWLAGCADKTLHTFARAVHRGAAAPIEEVAATGSYCGPAAMP